MGTMSDIKESLEYSIKEDTFIVYLSPKHYQLDRLEQYPHYLKETEQLLQGTLLKQDKEEIIIEYTLRKNILPMSQVLKDMNSFSRLQLAQQMYILNDLYHSIVCPFLHPDNLFVIGNRLYIGHRGFKAGVYPNEYTKKDFLKQYRALVLYVLHPKLDYNHLIEGNGTLKDELSRRIQESSSVEEIIEIIDNQLSIETKKRKFQFTTVKKNTFNTYKWSTMILGGLSILSLFGLGYYYFHEIPMKDRVISAESEFMNHDYEGVLETLEKDNPTLLPKSAQYVGAVSSIKLDNLSNNQKDSILKTISQKSNENILLYWMYIGNGAFKKALNIAKNIGDNQYILHAYIKLYDATKENSKMDGTKKQELLEEYKKAIHDYTKKLGGN